MPYKHGLHVLKWRMTKKTYVLYIAFARTAVMAEPGTDIFEEAVEGLKMLPGYPGPAEGDDGIEYQPEIIDESTVSVLH